jgi:mycoredoxin
MAHTRTITQLYGATWCADCKRSRTFLDSHAIPYEYVDIDTVPGAAEAVSRLNNGYKSIPTIVFSDGTVLVEPSQQMLADALSIK